mmetsp:Transcript_95435/g.274897  ORF Transcript_95435/g.274897 Transcript_95435/m.274897 type:complete len:237 (+) Transcript_95435:112-822(+)|eukprot:CAMPEP_0170445376 /NCGR_PEP_ID=MMETSP0117_2-20130122/49028_1 /TAXON_ID=400756 /ORGANISM="Durinskia baltica, Strain CSIRO CS-38" /LENGTH=236 /DNA_ID=CAMNT_0010706247 /DNA_START=125 /DNA_END=835 /DNA_ORIENTATION=-
MTSLNSQAAGPVYDGICFGASNVVGFCDCPHIHLGHRRETCVALDAPARMGSARDAAQRNPGGRNWHAHRAPSDVVARLRIRVCLLPNLRLHKPPVQGAEEEETRTIIALGCHPPGCAARAPKRQAATFARRKIFRTAFLLVDVSLVEERPSLELQKVVRRTEVEVQLRVYLHLLSTGVRHEHGSAVCRRDHARTLCAVCVHTNFLGRRFDRLVAIGVFDGSGPRALLGVVALHAP